MDLLHRLEARVENANKGRAKAFEEGRERWLPDWLREKPTTMSDAVRRVTEIGLNVLDGDADEIEELMCAHFATRLQDLLARAVVDPNAMTQLKRIADAAKEPDFG